MMERTCLRIGNRSSGSNGGAGGSLLTPGQASALIGLYNAFTPTNQAQATALQNVFSTFAK
jgi:hypothetical protein